MPYNFAAGSFHTKKLCSTLSSRKVHFLYGKRKNFAFEAPFGGLGATYAVHLRIIRTLLGDFLLVIIELFFAMCFRFLTIHAFDGQTDERHNDHEDHACTQCRAVKSRHDVAIHAFYTDLLPF